MYQPPPDQPPSWQQSQPLYPQQPWPPQPQTEPPPFTTPQSPTQYPPPYQQQGYYQQQYTPPPPYYQQPVMPPPMFVQPPPPKRHNGCLIAVAVLVALFIFGTIVNAVSGTHSDTSNTTSSTTQATDTPTPTDTPTRPLKWTTVQAFSGNGQKKTSVFTVPDHWRLKWKCNPASDYFGSYNVIIDVYNSDGTPLDIAAINTICQHGNTSGDTEEYQGGDVYLDVQITDVWTITVQVLQ